MSEDRPALLLADVLDEPASLATLLDAYDAGRGGPLAAVPASAAGRRVVLCGLGSSRFAALDAATELAAAGVAVTVEYASTAVPAPAGPDTVLVAVSAGGRTAEVAAAVERHRGTSLVLAVTNDPDGPVARGADVHLPLLAGTERAGVACRTYLATVAVLALLGARLGGRPVAAGDLWPAVAALRAVHDGRDRWLGPATDAIDGADRLAVIGGAAELGAVEQGALMLREGPRLAAVAHEAGDWLHTAVYTALPGHRALLLAGSAYDEVLVRTIAGRGGRVVRIGPAGPGVEVPLPLPDAPDGPVGRACRRLLAATAVELIAAEAWRRAAAVEVTADGSEARGGEVKRP